MKERTLSIIFKVVAIAASIYGMSWTFCNEGFLTYFTNLSNIAIDLGLFVSLIFVLSNKKPSNKWYMVKFLLTVSIMLTFLIFLCILAPTDKRGFVQAYIANGCGSLCVHFITPLLSILDFILLDYSFETKKKYAIYGIIPPLMYVCAIIILGQCFGVRWYGDMYAPYNFMNYGAECGWFGIALDTMGSKTIGIGFAYMIMVLCAIFILLGLVLLSLVGLRKKKVKSN